MLLDPADPHRLAGVRIGDDQRLRVDRGDGGPDALADADADAVFAVADLVGPVHLAPLVADVGLHHLRRLAGEARGVAGLRLRGVVRRLRHAFAERVGHEVGHVREHCLDPRDLAVADAEGFEQGDRVGPLERGLHLAPVGEVVVVEFVGVVEEAAADGDAALGVDDEEVAADALVDLVDAELELVLAAAGDRRGVAARAAGGRGGGGDAVFEPTAIVGEVREDLAVVQFDGAEIAVGDRQHALARAALLGREDLVELGVVDASWSRRRTARAARSCGGPRPRSRRSRRRRSRGRARRRSPACRSR